MNTKKPPVPANKAKPQTGPKKTSGTPPRHTHQRTFRRRSRRFRTGVRIAVVLGLAIVLLGVIYWLNTGSGSSTGTNAPGTYPFVVGNPGPGEQAPAVRLPVTDGSTFDLAAWRGKTVLLFFQEGLSCQPCWDQIKDMEAQIGQFKALGIDEMVSITTNPLDALKQKVADEGIKMPVLADTTFAVSLAYHANEYGMMNGTSDGHSFVIVGPDGLIRWRADYGGPPRYTMYIPLPALLADIKEGLRGKA